MDQTELVEKIQDRIDDITEFLSSDRNDSAYDREYAYGLNDAYVTVLDFLGVQHGNEYHN